MGYPPKLAQRVDLLAAFERSDRIQLLIDIAERFREVPERIARRPFSPDHKVPGCESEVYLWAEALEGGGLRFHFAVENPQGISARAMAVILDETLSGEDPRAVASVSGDVVYEVFGRELSMGKSMGLMGMVARVQSSAKKELAARPTRSMN